MTIQPKIITPFDEIAENMPMEIYNLKMEVKNLKIKNEALEFTAKELNAKIEILKDLIVIVRKCCNLESEQKTLEHIVDVLGTFTDKRKVK
jgi:hypothetical protein